MEPASLKVVSKHLLHSGAHYWVLKRKRKKQESKQMTVSYNLDVAYKFMTFDLKEQNWAI